MANSKPQQITGYSTHQTSLAERTLLTAWRYVGEYHAHLVLVGGLVPRYLVDGAADRKIEVGSGHCGTLDVDLGISLAVSEKETYKSIRKALLERAKCRPGKNETGKEQRHSFVLPISETEEVNIDFLTVEYHGPETVVRAVEDDLSAIQVEGLGLALKDPIQIHIKADLLTGDGVYSATIPICRVVPFVVLKALAFAKRGERKDAYDLVYTLSRYKDGPAAVAEEVREDERKADSFQHATSEMQKLFASENDNGAVAYGNFLGNRGQAAMAYAAVQEFLAALKNA